MVAGKLPLDTRASMPSSLVVTYSTNFLAASSLPSGIFLVMASPLPPYSPLMGVPSMVGRRATRNLPVAWGTPCRRLLAIHAPLMRLAMEPSPSDFIQSSVQVFVWTSMRSSSRIFCQRSMNRWAPLSLAILMVSLSSLSL